MGVEKTLNSVGNDVRRKDCEEKRSDGNYESPPVRLEVVDVAANKSAPRFYTRRGCQQIGRRVSEFEERERRFDGDEKRNLVDCDADGTSGDVRYEVTTNDIQRFCPCGFGTLDVVFTDFVECSAPDYYCDVPPIH